MADDLQEDWSALRKSIEDYRANHSPDSLPSGNELFGEGDVTIETEDGRTMVQSASSVHTGNGNPQVALGVVGDTYYDITRGVLYGPKTKDGWGSFSRVSALDTAPAINQRITTLPLKGDVGIGGHITGTPSFHAPSKVTQMEDELKRKMRTAEDALVQAGDEYAKATEREDEAKRMIQKAQDQMGRAQTTFAVARTLIVLASIMFASSIAFVATAIFG